MVDGKQLTVIWHVDNLKISHVDPAVVSDTIALLNQRYGKLAPVTVTRGKTHDYLGMTLDFSTDGQCAIRMDDYVDRVLSEAPSDMEGHAETPAGKHLFEVNPKGIPLSNENKDIFHTFVAKLLFLAKWAQPDILTAISFLCTRTQNPDQNNWKKLRRVLRYLRAYPHLPLTLEASNLQTVWWSVDASFAVHPDMRSHTGACGSLCKGMFYSSLGKQKLNTQSSTEAELVGVDDTMSKILWTRQFLQAQGYEVGPATVHQDNQSAILLEKMGHGPALIGRDTSTFGIVHRILSNQ